MVHRRWRGEASGLWWSVMYVWPLWRELRKEEYGIGRASRRDSAWRRHWAGWWVAPRGKTARSRSPTLGRNGTALDKPSCSVAGHSVALALMQWDSVIRGPRYPPHSRFFLEGRSEPLQWRQLYFRCGRIMLLFEGSNNLLIFPYTY